MNYRNQTELDQWILAATPGALGPMFMTQRGLLLYNQYKPATADLKLLRKQVMPRLNII